MRPILVAFDVDGTLVDEDFRPIEENRTLLVLLSRMRNVRIHLWSGSGEWHAHRVAALLGISAYVSSYGPKAGTADIAIDDVAGFSLATFNLITGGPDDHDDRGSDGSPGSGRG